MGSAGGTDRLRVVFGRAVCSRLEKSPAQERLRTDTNACPTFRLTCAGEELRRIGVLTIGARRIEKVQEAVNKVNAMEQFFARSLKSSRHAKETESLSESQLERELHQTRIIHGRTHYPEGRRSVEIGAG